MAANPSDRAPMLTARHVLQLLGSLDAADIVGSFRTVCSQILGPCEAAVFVLVPDDPRRMVAFGEDGDETPVPTPPIEPFGSPGDATFQEVEGSGGKWMAHAALGDADEVIGLLRVVFDHPVVGSWADALNTLARALTVAVRNGHRFENTKRLTFTDDLTALHNSRFMALYLDREIKRCRRTRSPLCLLFMDLDGFKNINDTHGHLAGSKTLVEVGAVLENTVRDADILIRYGGDEFVILFPETPLSGGLIIAERVRQMIEDTKFLESQQIDARISASIGLSAYPENADDVRGLIASADRAMYEAKALGKNRVVAASPLSTPESPKRSLYFP